MLDINKRLSVDEAVNLIENAELWELGKIAYEKSSLYILIK